MNVYQQIQEYNEPSEILAHLQREEQIIDSEMIPSERGFLCGLIKHFRPRKLVEVGVAGGGTSAVILHCIQSLGLDTEMYSVDLSEKFYRMPEKPCGYLIHTAEKCGISLRHHTLMLGKVVAARLDEIGHDIDFLILDTKHVMPGENLDFLVCFPYLKNGAVVVMHDTALQFQTDGVRAVRDDRRFATSILFQTVVADKFLNNAIAYPNIAAFQITEDTSKYIADVFTSLMIPWQYIPEGEELHAYEAVLMQHYPEDCMRIYYQAKRQMMGVPCVELQNILSLFAEQNILLYGTRNTAQVCFSYLQNMGIEVAVFVVSDGRKKADLLNNLPVYYFSEIPFDKTNTLIIQANGSEDVTAILKASNWRWLKVYQIA